LANCACRAPLVTRLTRSETARWCAFIAPPFEPFVPAWNAQGVRLDRLLVVRTGQPLWALEQSLLSGACSITFAWPQRATMPQLRRLSLATERGMSLGVCSGRCAPRWNTPPPCCAWR
jgi:cell division inhibitor SulA